MNKNLKAVYYCATSNHRWGKGLTIAEAKKNADLIKKKDEKRCQFSVVAAIFDNPDIHELTNLKDCITYNRIDGSPEFYKDDVLLADRIMIEQFFVGWLTVEKNY